MEENLECNNENNHNSQVLFYSVAFYKMFSISKVSLTNFKIPVAKYIFFTLQLKCKLDFSYTFSNGYCKIVSVTILKFFFGYWDIRIIIFENTVYNLFFNCI